MAARRRRPGHLPAVGSAGSADPHGARPRLWLRHPRPVLPVAPGGIPERAATAALPRRTALLRRRRGSRVGKGGGRCRRVARRVGTPRGAAPARRAPRGRGVDRARRPPLRRSGRRGLARAADRQEARSPTLPRCADLTLVTPVRLSQGVGGRIGSRWGVDRVDGSWTIAASWLGGTHSGKRGITESQASPSHLFSECSPAIREPMVRSEGESRTHSRTGSYRGRSPSRKAYTERICRSSRASSVQIVWRDAS